MAIVLTADEVPLYTGFLVPNGAKQTTQSLDATSTAIALLYFALGGFLLDQSDREAVLADIADAPEVTNLAAAIDARIAMGETPLTQDSGPVAEALLVARASVAARIAEGKAVAPNEVKQLDTTLSNLLLEPDANTRQSGMQILQADAGGILAQNNFRRRAWLYRYRTAFTDLEGNETTLDPPELIGEPEKIATTFAFGEISGTFAWFDGSAPFAPRQFGPFPLPEAPTSSRTEYDVVLVGANLNPLSTPNDFTDPLYAPFLDEWQSRYAFLQAETFVVDFLLSVVMLAATGAQSAIQANKVNHRTRSRRGDWRFARFECGRRVGRDPGGSYGSHRSIGPYHPTRPNVHQLNRAR